MWWQIGAVREQVAHILRVIWILFCWANKWKAQDDISTYRSGEKYENLLGINAVQANCKSMYENTSKAILWYQEREKSNSHCNVSCFQRTLKHNGKSHVVQTGNFKVNISCEGHNRPQMTYGVTQDTGWGQSIPGWCSWVCLGNDWTNRGQSSFPLLAPALCPH